MEESAQSSDACFEGGGGGGGGGVRRAQTRVLKETSSKQVSVGLFCSLIGLFIGLFSSLVLKKTSS